MIKKGIATIFPIAALILAGCGASVASTYNNPIPNTGSLPQASTVPENQPIAIPSLAPTKAPTTAPTKTSVPRPTLRPSSTPASNSGTAPFMVTEVDGSVNLDTFHYDNGPCQATYIFQANIFSSGPGTVTYYWQRSDGTISDKATLTFSNASMQTVTDTWTVKSANPYLSGWNRVFIDQPNHIAFTAVGVNLTCSDSIPTKVPGPKNSGPGLGAPPLAPTPVIPKKKA